MQNSEVNFMALTDKITCPIYDSEEIIKNKVSPTKLALSILLLGFPIPFIVKAKHITFLTAITISN